VFEGVAGVTIGVTFVYGDVGVVDVMVYNAGVYIAVDVGVVVGIIGRICIVDIIVDGYVVDVVDVYVGVG